MLNWKEETGEQTTPKHQSAFQNHNDQTKNQSSTSKWMKSSFFLKKALFSSTLTSTPTTSSTQKRNLLDSPNLLKENYTHHEQRSITPGDAYIADHPGHEDHVINEDKASEFENPFIPKEVILDQQDNVCPICSISLKFKSFEDASQHVNDCLDASTLENLSELTHPTENHTVKEDFDTTTLHQLPSQEENQTPNLESQRNDSVHFVHKNHVSSFTLPMDEEVIVNSKDCVYEEASVEEIFKVADDISNSNQAKGKSKKCPWYKKLPYTAFTVDAFNYGKIHGIEGYFLSHFHADHYGGLTSKFDYGPIFCSPVTGNLVIQQLKVKPQYVVKLELNKRHLINDVYVTFFDANHCPGAVIILFEIPNNSDNSHVRILHTGDFRAHASHLQIPELLSNPIDSLYLDTTYCSPSHKFPSQESVIETSGQLAYGVLVEGKMLQDLIGDFKPLRKQSEQLTSCKSAAFLMRQWIMKGTMKTSPNEKTNEKKSELFEGCGKTSSFSSFSSSIEHTQCGKSRTLILVGSYTIGKERVYLSMAKRANSKIYVETSKRKILECLDWPELMNFLTMDPMEADIHVMSMGHLKEPFISQKLNKLNRKKFNQIIVVRPTGWTFRPNKLHANQDILTFSLNHLKPSYSQIIFQGRPISVATIGIPYSEHSSFLELQMFLKGLKWWPQRVIPTVNVGNPKRRKEMDHILSQWRKETNVK